MKCKKCNKEIANNSKFCLECGEKVEIKTNIDKKVIPIFIGTSIIILILSILLILIIPKLTYNNCLKSCEKLYNEGSALFIMNNQENLLNCKYTCIKNNY